MPLKANENRQTCFCTVGNKQVTGHRVALLTLKDKAIFGEAIALLLILYVQLRVSFFKKAYTCQLGKLCS